MYHKLLKHGSGHSSSRRIVRVRMLSVILWQEHVGKKGPYVNYAGESNEKEQCIHTPLIVTASKDWGLLYD